MNGARFFVVFVLITFSTKAERLLFNVGSVGCFEFCWINNLDIFDAQANETSVFTQTNNINWIAYGLESEQLDFRVILNNTNSIGIAGAPNEYI